MESHKTTPNHPTEPAKRRAKRKAQAQAQARRDAVNDLLRQASGFVPSAMQTILETVSENLALVELADTPEAEDACVEKISERLKEWEPADLARVSIRGCVQELLHYRHDVRRQILEAALTRARDLAGKEKRFLELLPRLRRACRSLDPRTKAVLRVTSEILKADHVVNGDFYAKALQPARCKADVTLLRSEPKLAALMEAYELSEDLLTVRL